MISNMQPPQQPQTSPRTSRGWRVYFFGLFTLALIGVLLPIWYNLGQQLREEQVIAARQSWRQHGPADYDLTYSVQYDREPLAQRHVVLVRKGKIAFASCEGELVQLDKGLQSLTGLTGHTQGRGMNVERFFDRLDELLREQSNSPQRHFLVAVFDPRDGLPRRILRRVRSESIREEWNLKLWQAGELTQLAAQREKHGS
jgi:hypothetical protein